MCGIIGYVGTREVVPILLEGLRRLEYRGYDSAGIAVWNPWNKTTIRVRSEGKIENLVSKVEQVEIRGSVGIGHTRWATHGAPSELNAHPHKAGPFTVVHNGIIENAFDLRKKLEDQGCIFESDTDTEVLVHLANLFWKQGASPGEAIRMCLENIRGTYAVVFLCDVMPDVLFAARKESPLVIGSSEDGTYVASDVPALLPFTNRVVYLEEGDFAVIRRNGFEITDRDGAPVARPLETVDWNPVLAEKGNYRHFMQKEIFEQPRAVSDTIKPYMNFETGKVVLPYATFLEEVFKDVSRIVFTACGTSYHAALVGKYMFESMLRIPCNVELASEFRYRDPILDGKTLVVGISQSGETADTKGAISLARDAGCPTCSIVNVVGSSLARMTDAVIYTHAGPEIGVASTKAFTAQLAALALMVLYASCVRNAGETDLHLRFKEDLLRMPGLMEEILGSHEILQDWAMDIHHALSALYLGRHVLFPIALEGALKLKEISYIHAEGYAAGEMKHGPIALVDENLPVVCLMQHGVIGEKIRSNLQEVEARGGRVFLVADELAAQEAGLESKLSYIFKVPICHDLLSPLLFVLPMQLLAYYVAVERGTDVDQPRNLAKSVTVE
ncbi:glutamine--fructose-6-phosphate transaminase (isomerizing) [Thermodesulforhabdus norvegica]|uniref:Glutamine--fructose-6-phosphate aminotransferase [isomerizing] n=1 Tax=Thermodesulforhabdus norvegica TaxID=39841 RepID=A0A1I4VCX2_9BACT|nr:glutamine--fructose-6-phosphate transaminase (isomerizing) [Thermodesulforhabdus norvegica]SFM98950.1 glutamine--fructose-6-phosphate transaminase [Thermodesulforhabdus norvegica]